MNRWTWIVVVLVIAAGLVVLVRHLMPAPVKVAATAATARFAAAVPALVGPKRMSDAAIG